MPPPAQGSSPPCDSSRSSLPRYEIPACTPQQSSSLNAAPDPGHSLAPARALEHGGLRSEYCPRARESQHASHNPIPTSGPTRAKRTSASLGRPRPVRFTSPFAALTTSTAWVPLRPKLPPDPGTPWDSSRMAPPSPSRPGGYVAAVPPRLQQSDRIATRLSETRS